MDCNNLPVGYILKNGEYRILCTLGQGGFGVTYQAEQVSLGRKVAIKEFFMKEYCSRNSGTYSIYISNQGSLEQIKRYRAKFLKEARMIASLYHPGIIRVLDVFEENGTAYYVMVFLSGGSLKDKVDKEGALQTDEINKYMNQICLALEYLHGQNILHLDIKPSNILFDKNGNAVLIDFGISKHYDESGEQTTSTPAGISKGFAPLEQYQIGSLDTFTPATDIYSLGATLYYMVTGTVPPEAITIYNQGLPSLNSSIPDYIKETIKQSMQSRREDRPQNVEKYLSLLTEDEISEDDTNLILNQDNIIKRTDTEHTNEYNKQTTNQDIEKKAKEVQNKVIATISYCIYKQQRKYRWKRYPIVFGILFVFFSTIAYCLKDILFDGLQRLWTDGSVDYFIFYGISLLSFILALSLIVTVASCSSFIDRELSSEWDEEVIEKKSPMNFLTRNYKITWLFEFLCPNDSEGVIGFLSSLSFFLPLCMWLENSFYRNSFVPNASSLVILGVCLMLLVIYQSDFHSSGGRYSWIENKRFFKEDKLVETDSISNLNFYFYGLVSRERWIIEKGKVDYHSSTWASEGSQKIYNGQIIKFQKIDGQKRSEGIEIENGHEYVDLGLSVKWATCNIGASLPEQKGLLYAWGETKEKESYARGNYSFYENGDWLSSLRLSKYVTKKRFGRVDNKKELDLNDDVAHVVWGGIWRMPTDYEMRELMELCIWEPVTYNGINGYFVRSKKYGPERFIFLPYVDSQEGTIKSVSGCYWTNTLYDYMVRSATILSFGQYGKHISFDSRYHGLPVRAVCS